MVTLLSVVQVFISVVLIFLVLMHSGKDSGLSGAFGVGTGAGPFGGGSLVERNLNRWTIGCAIAFVNFHWLKRVVSALADRATASGERQSSKGVVLRFLLRYFLIALVAYAIFKISRNGLYGLLAGLFLPVGAILLEAFYELYVALRRGV